MKRSVVQFVLSNRRSVLLATLAVCVSTLGIVAWQASANNVPAVGRQANLVPQKKNLVAPLATYNANPATLGSIADPVGAPTCGNLTAPARDVTFTVAGLSGPPTAVQVSMTFNPAHTWRTDLVATLIAPNATQFDIFNRINGTTATACGPGDDFGGPYAFLDTAAANIWTTTGSPTPTGSYRTSAAITGTATSINTAFAGIPTSNGTWILRIRDTGVGDLGDISAATLTLTAPLAAGVEVSGRVLTADGRGITNARVSISDTGGITRIATTGRSGYFIFSDVEPGRAYTISVSSRRFTFAPQIIQPQDNISGLDFYAQ